MITLQITPTKTMPIKAHRVLKKRYPSLKLYAHFGITEDDGTYRTDRYCISLESGFSVTKYNYGSLYEAVADTIRAIDWYGETKAAALDKQKAIELAEQRSEGDD